MRSKVSIVTALLLVLLALSVVIAGCAGKSGAPAAKEIKYPTKPVTFIVIFTPGGPMDTQSRAMEKHWKEQFNNQPLVFEYKVGAGGQVGMTEIARANPDGYTIGGFSFPHIVLQSLGPQATFKVEDFAYIAQAVNDPQVLAVKEDSNIKNLQDFIAEAKKKNGELTVGIVGTLSGQHLAVLKLMELLDIKVKPVVFPASVDQGVALMGGHIDAQFGNLTDVTRLRGKVRGIAIASNKRHDWIKDVPTFKEQGYNLISDIRRGVIAPAKVDPAILKKLKEGIGKILNKPEYLADMEKLQVPAEYLPGEEFQKIINDYYKEATAIIEKYGLIQKK